MSTTFANYEPIQGLKKGGDFPIKAGDNTFTTGISFGSPIVSDSNILTTNVSIVVT